MDPASKKVKDIKTAQRRAITCDPVALNKHYKQFLFILIPILG